MAKKEYALVVDGAFVEIRRYESQPVDIPHKRVTWLPVVRETVDTSTQEYKNSAVVKTLEPTRYLIQTQITDKTPAEITALLDQKKDLAEAQLDSAYNIVKALGAVLFETVNEVRTLKSQPTLSAAQFRAYVRGKL